jgi:hypothetical protein
MFPNGLAGTDVRRGLARGEAPRNTHWGFGSPQPSVTRRIRWEVIPCLAGLVDRATAVVPRYGARSTRSPATGSWRCSVRRPHRRTALFFTSMGALDVQKETQRLAAEVHCRDGVGLPLRVRLNSGQVIAAEIGSGALGYTAIKAPDRAVAVLCIEGSEPLGQCGTPTAVSAKPSPRAGRLACDTGALTGQWPTLPIPEISSWE